MAGLDMKLLREQSKVLDKRANGGDNNLVYSKSLTEDGKDFRITEPTDAMNGMYYVDQHGWWIKGKFYQSNKTFNGEDVIAEEVKAARETDDPELIALLDAKDKSMKVVKEEWRSLVPGYFLNVKYSEDESTVESISVVDDAGKILVAKPTLMSAIHTVVTNKQYQNGTKNGLTDREKGWNLVLGKKGSGLDTEYYCVGWNMATKMDDKYYEGERFPDVRKFVNDVKCSDAYLRSVIRNYLYGEEILQEKKDKDAAAKPAANAGTGAGAAASTARPDTKAAATGGAAASARPNVNAAGGAAKSARPSVGGAATGKGAGSSKKRSLLDDAENDAGTGKKADEGMEELD